MITIISTTPDGYEHRATVRWADALAVARAMNNAWLYWQSATISGVAKPPPDGEPPPRRP